MEYDTTTYFEENEEDAVKGFTIIGHAASGSDYHIAEKWVKPDADDKWIQYEIPAERVKARVEQEKCEPKGKLTEEQFAAVCDNVNIEIDPEKVVA